MPTQVRYYTGEQQSGRVNTATLDCKCCCKHTTHLNTIGPCVATKTAAQVCLGKSSKFGIYTLVYSSSGIVMSALAVMSHSKLRCTDVFEIIHSSQSSQGLASRNGCHALIAHLWLADTSNFCKLSFVWHTHTHFARETTVCREKHTLREAKVVK